MTKEGYAKPKHGVRYFKLGEGFDLQDIRLELEHMTDVLMGRDEPPVDLGVSTLIEVAEAYHARAREIEMHISQLENEGHVLKGSAIARFRTTELRWFIELTRKAIDIGSRRITRWVEEMRMRG